MILRAGHTHHIYMHISRIMVKIRNLEYKESIYFISIHFQERANKEKNQFSSENSRMFEEAAPIPLKNRDAHINYLIETNKKKHTCSVVIE